MKLVQKRLSQPLRFMFILLFFLFTTTSLHAQTNYALVFGNTNDYVSIPNAAASSITTTATFEAWINPATDNETGRIIDHITPGVNDGFLFDLVSGKVRIIFGNYWTEGSTVLAANTWYHVAVTNNGSTLCVYVNGVLDASASFSGSMPANSHPVFLGIDQSGGSHFLGIMDEIRIWNISRTASQIQASMNSNLTGSESGLVGYWPMNEGAGTTIYDQTSNANNGTLTNFSLTSTSGWVDLFLPEPPSSGDGTSSNPYTIANLKNLNWLSQTDSVWDKNFVQTADIDAYSTRYWNVSGADTLGFSPIGTENEPFTGIYNGAGHVIKGLFINRPAIDHIGVFGSAYGAAVDSLGISEINITGKLLVGGLIGSVDSSSVTACYSTGNVYGIAFIGGLIGLNENYSTVSACYSTSNVHCNVGLAGGLIGGNNNSSTVFSCYSTGSVSGYNFIGGLLGQNDDYSTVFSCYSTGSVSGVQYVGGLLAANNDFSSVTACYSTGRVTASSDLGGFTYGNAFILKNCYWNTETSGILLGVGNDSNSQTVTGLTTTAMKKKSSFSSWDFINTWAIRADSTYPALSNVDNAPFAFADTTSGDLSALLANDYDYETGQTNLVLKTDSIYSYTYGIAYNAISEAQNHDSLYVLYRVGEQLSSGDTLWGNQAQSILVYQESVSVNLTVADTTIATGTGACFDAQSEITVAGSSAVTIANNASASFIAGTSIRFLPGFHAEAGSYVHGWITVDGSFCDAVAVSGSVLAVSAEKSQVLSLSNERSEKASIEKSIKVYPNPNNGQFNIAITSAGEGQSNVQIYNLQGVKVYSGKVNNREANEISLKTIKSGLYVVEITYGAEKVFWKMMVR